MPCSSVVLKEEEEEEEEKAKPSSWKDAGYRLEKIFPVYAMGRFVRDVSTTADAVSISDDSDADPIWDAMRAEAKSEVTFFFFSDLGYCSGCEVFNFIFGEVLV